MKTKQLIIIGIYISLMFVATQSVAASDAEGYDLYKQYQQLQKNMADSDKEQVLAFINDHPDSIFSRKLRDQWLKLKAKNKQWQEFLNVYKPTGNIHLQCHYMTALYNTEQKAAAYHLAEKLWLHAHSRPASCDHVFNAWIKADKLTESLLWQRFNLAVLARDWTMTKHLKKLMTKQQRISADRWLRAYRSASSIFKMKLSDNEVNRYIVIHAIRRMTSASPDKAAKTWETLSKKYQFTNEQNQILFPRLAYKYALRGHANSDKWFSKIDKQHMDNNLYEWKVRSQLLRKDWQKISDSIDDMPEELSNKASWLYWKGVALDKLGKKDQAKQFFAKAAKQGSYYGFLAQHYDGKDVVLPEADIDTKFDEDIDDDYDPVLDKVGELVNKKHYRKATILTYHLAENLQLEDMLFVIKTYQKWNWHIQSFRLLRRFSVENFWDLSHPFAYSDLIESTAKKYKLPKELIFAIMRQESAFMYFAKSHAGATGLMQLMPATAQRMSKRIGKPVNRKNLTKPSLNIELGSAYLQKLQNEFRHYALVIAAYNAGERNVRRWKSLRKKMPPAIWIETIPYRETRDYVKRVIGNFLVYQQRLDKDPDMSRFMKPIP